MLQRAMNEIWSSGKYACCTQEVSTVTCAVHRIMWDSVIRFRFLLITHYIDLDTIVQLPLMSKLNYTQIQTKREPPANIETE